MTRSVMCGWCHASCVAQPGRPTYCPACGHRAGVARMECDCPECDRARARHATDTTFHHTAVRLAIITTVAQLGGGVRYLLHTPAEARRQRDLVRASGLPDTATPLYAVDADRRGRLTAEIYPGADLSPAEWAAIKEAIR